MQNRTKHLLSSGAIIVLASFFTLAANAWAADPEISNVSVSVQKTTATISWQTDETAIGTLSYGTTSGSYTNTATTTSDTVHVAYLADLKAGTTYYYKISVEATDGSTTETNESTFATYSGNPQLVSSEVVTRTSDKIVIKTTANTYVKVTIKYGTSASDLSSTSKSSDFIQGSFCTGQQVNYNLLKNLQPNTTYYYTIALYPVLATCDEDTASVVVSGVKSIKSTGRPIITGISPKTGKSGTRVTITGQNFGEGMSKGHNPVDAVVSFGCALPNWQNLRGSNPKCLGWIESWSNTKIVAKTLKTAVTGPVYIGKAFTGDSYGTWSNLKMFVLKGPKFTVKK